MVSALVPGLSARVIHNSGPQVLVSQTLVFFQPLEVNGSLPLLYKLSIWLIYYIDWLYTFCNSKICRERDSSLLVDFDYDRNLFECEQNSASPVL